jgi:hypothetical protein
MRAFYIISMEIRYIDRFRPEEDRKNGVAGPLQTPADGLQLARLEKPPAAPSDL